MKLLSIMVMAREVWFYHCFYSGRVQGVGFRYKTAQIACGYDISGFVRNLSDGRVELWVEGEREDVTCFSSDLEDAMGDFIRRKEVREGYGDTRESGFAIR